MSIGPGEKKFHDMLRAGLDGNAGVLKSGDVILLSSNGMSCIGAEGCVPSGLL